MIGEGATPYQNDVAVTEASLAKALSALKKFDVVGIFEDYEVTSALLYVTLKGKIPTSLADTQAKFKASKTYCQKGASGFETQNCVFNGRIDRDKKYKRMKLVIRGEASNAEEKEVLRESGGSNKFDRKLYSAAVERHCKQLQRYGLSNLPDVKTALKKASLCQ